MDRRSQVSMPVLAHGNEADGVAGDIYPAKSRKDAANTNGQPSIAIITLNPNDVRHIKGYTCVGSTAEAAEVGHCHQYSRGRV